MSDALSNIGKDPVNNILEKVSICASKNISISFIGINLNDEGEELARKIVDIGKGRLYKLSNLDEVDTIVLDDYERI